MATLKLFCLVDGEPSSGAFPVDIAAANTVGDLKDAIKIKMTPKFDDIATGELTLWRVSIPVSADDEEESPITLDTLNKSKPKSSGQQPTPWTSSPTCQPRRQYISLFSGLRKPWAHLHPLQILRGRGEPKN
ncbi:hypothetical protein BGZ54_007329 [Gamsiella multidivaricata]|nr:hypothetical protein BGZ54_007329 [Gamsiella multidivaricata]